MNVDLTIRLGAVEPDSLRVASLSELGDRSHNEDSFDYWQSDSWLCCVVADGAGGHKAGEVASKQAVHHFIELFKLQPSTDPAHLERLVFQVNEKILRAQRSCASQQDMHTTIVALVVDLGLHFACWVHVGDSRLYRLRQGVLFARTKDHSVVQWMKDAKDTGADPSRQSTSRNELYTALGTSNDFLTVAMQSTPVRVQAGDQFLLCTDGLWDSISDDEMVSVALVNSQNPSDFLTHLQRLSTARAAGRADNMTGVAVFFE